MDRLPSRENLSDSEHQARKEHNLKLITTLRERISTVSEGGGGRYVERHRSRDKMLARERIERIIDPGTAFLELSTLACLLYTSPSPRDQRGSRMPSSA